MSKDKARVWRGLFVSEALGDRNINGLIAHASSSNFSPVPRGPNPAGRQKAREPHWFIAQDSEPQPPNIYKCGRGVWGEKCKGSGIQL